MSKLDAALALAARGFKVFPIKAGAKAPPLLKDWPNLATVIPSEIDTWWGTSANANIGIHCEGLLVIDVDVKKNGDETLENYLNIHDLDLPDTRVVRTPTGGRHIYFQLPKGHPGVPNGVDVLGPGVDTRSTGGYVVAPGSTVPAGEYSVVWDEAIAEAPAWLIDRLGTVKPKDTVRVKAIIPDASEDVVLRAGDWLRTAERSVKGQGGDQAAYRVACRLRDLGVSELQAGELMRSDAWDHGCGWRGGFLEAKPIHSAYRYASGEPGSKAVLAGDFPVVDSSAQVPTPARPRAAAQHMDDFADPQFKLPPYLIKGLLTSQSYALMYGAPGEGKTFTALDMAYHVAAGRPWMDHRVNAGVVLYLPYEGAGGMRKRVQALRQHYGVSAPLYICPTRANMREQAGRHEIRDLLATLPEKPALIVFDTFAHALCGGDENSAQDVGAFNAGVQALIAATGACVLVLHHPGKNSANGARGSSALLGAVDTEIEVVDHQVRATKQRDIELGEPIGFKLTPIPVGMDEDAEMVTSCVVEPAKIAVRSSLLKPDSQPGRAFKVLCDARPSNDPITELEWKQKCDEFLSVRDNGKGWFDAKRRLFALKLIVQGADGLFRRVLT